MKYIFDAWYMFALGIIPVCLIAIFITFLFLKWQLKNQVMIVLFLLMFISFFSLFIMRHMIRNEVSEHLDEYSFIISSSMDVDEQKLISALKKQRYITTNRTRPEKINTLRIVINLGEIELWIAEDSDNSDICWVYYPKYLYSRSNEIGKIRIR